MATPVKFSFSLGSLEFAIWGTATEAWQFASSREKGLQCGNAKNSACQSGPNTVSLVVVCPCQLLLSAPAVWNPDLALWGLPWHAVCVRVCRFSVIWWKGAKRASYVELYLLYLHITKSNSKFTSSHETPWLRPCSAPLAILRLQRSWW